MPSRYEPCGLNQMYSLVYGTLPIVRSTGGLVDTVENFNEKTGSGTGFMFDYLSPSSIYDTVGWAVWAWYNRKSDIEKMQKRGMTMDFSWELSAQKYVKLYEETLKTAGITVKKESVVVEEPQLQVKVEQKVKPKSTAVESETKTKQKSPSIKPEPKAKQKAIPVKSKTKEKPTVKTEPKAKPESKVKRKSPSKKK
jgi:hypothetical protein